MTRRGTIVSLALLTTGCYEGVGDYEQDSPMLRLCETWLDDDEAPDPAVADDADETEPPAEPPPEPPLPPPTDPPPDPAPMGPEDGYLVGDWNGDGIDELAVRRDHCIHHDLGDSVQCYGLGDQEDAYVTGDWDGNGGDDLAVRRGSCLLQSTDGDEQHDQQQCFGLGDNEAEYLVGDFDGNGVDDVAVRAAQCIHGDLDADGTEDFTQCFGNGDIEDGYLVGDWDGDGIDELAVRRGHCVHQNFDADGIEDVILCYGNGNAEDEYLVGDWDGDGSDGLAVRRGHCVYMDLDGDGAAHEVERCFGNGTAIAPAGPDAFALEANPLASGDTLRRFEQGGTQCRPDGTCNDPTRCLCPGLHDALLTGGKHYVSVGKAAGLDLVRDAGHRPAFYVDRLNSGWDPADPDRDWRNTGPKQRANEIFESMLAECGCDDRRVPRWVVLNEQARQPWKSDEKYRAWLLAVVKHLSQHHERKVLLPVQFKLPSIYDADHAWWWKQLDKYCYLGIEGYLSGQRVVDVIGNEVGAIRAEYQKMKDSFAEVGVRPQRLFLIEHFGQTLSGTDYGRAGIAAWKWKKVIVNRAAAARGMFFGVVSYGWKGNAMLESDDKRLGFMQTYMEQELP